MRRVFAGASELFVMEIARTLRRGSDRIAGKDHVGIFTNANASRFESVTLYGKEMRQKQLVDVERNKHGIEPTARTRVYFSFGDGGQRSTLSYKSKTRELSK
jgi:hypothetical protein